MNNCMYINKKFFILITFRFVGVKHKTILTQAPEKIITKSINTNHIQRSSYGGELVEPILRS